MTDVFAHGRITVRGARENNLKNITVDIPKNRLVVLTAIIGLSPSLSVDQVSSNRSPRSTVASGTSRRAGPLRRSPAAKHKGLRLAALLGSGLTGVLYVLDEPTTGLHSRVSSTTSQEPGSAGPTPGRGSMTRS